MYAWPEYKDEHHLPWHPEKNKKTCSAMYESTQIFLLAKHTFFHQKLWKFPGIAKEEP